MNNHTDHPQTIDTMTEDTIYDFIMENLPAPLASVLHIDSLDSPDVQFLGKDFFLHCRALLTPQERKMKRDFEKAYFRAGFDGLKKERNSDRVDGLNDLCQQTNANWYLIREMKRWFTEAARTDVPSLPCLRSKESFRRGQEVFVGVRDEHDQTYRYEPGRVAGAKHGYLQITDQLGRPLIVASVKSHSVLSEQDYNFFAHYPDLHQYWVEKIVQYQAVITENLNALQQGVEKSLEL